MDLLETAKLDEGDFARIAWLRTFENCLCAVESPEVDFLQVWQKMPFGAAKKTYFEYLTPAMEAPSGRLSGLECGP